VHVGALQVLDELQFEAFGVGEFADAGRDGFPLRKLRGAESPRTRDKFVAPAFVPYQRTNENGLKDTVEPDIFGQFGELRFFELASRIRLRFLNVLERNVLHCGHGGWHGRIRVGFEYGSHRVFS